MLIRVSICTEKYIIRADGRVVNCIWLQIRKIGGSNPSPHSKTSKAFGEFIRKRIIFFDSKSNLQKQVSIVISGRKTVCGNIFSLTIHLVMEQVRKIDLMPTQQQEVIATLVYKGKIAAIKLYMKFAGCRLQEAKNAVERIGNEIQPGQANG